MRPTAIDTIDKVNEIVDVINDHPVSELELGVKSITRNGTTFTATRLDGTTFTFTQQDNDTKALGSMTGTLAVGHGGTGATTAEEAFKNLSGYTLDLGTNNTTDTWVPVISGGKIQHRVIPTDVNKTSRWESSSGSGFVAYKRSGIVTISYISPSKKKYYNGALITTLPAGYRPPQSFCCVAYAGSTPSNVIINPDGKVLGWGGTNTEEFWRFAVSFPAA